VGLRALAPPTRQALLNRKGGFGTLILDEANRARRSGGMGQNAGSPHFAPMVDYQCDELLVAVGETLVVDLGAREWRFVDTHGA
jgi:hypothetical protein